MLGSLLHSTSYFRLLNIVSLGGSIDIQTFVFPFLYSSSITNTIIKLVFVNGQVWLISKLVVCRPVHYIVNLSFST